MSATFETMAEVLSAMPADAMFAVEGIARDIAGSSDGVVLHEDLVSEFYVWLAERPQRGNRWFYRPEGAKKDSFGWLSFRQDAAKIMARTAKKEKERSRGASDPDEGGFEYRARHLESMMLYVWNDPVLTVRGDDGDAPSTSTRNFDPYKTSDIMAYTFDLRAAYAKVVHPGGQWDEILQDLFRFGLTQDESAELQGLGQQAVSVIKRRAIRALLNELNGPPADRTNGGPGSRTVTSNAAAIARTRREQGFDE